MLDARQGAFPVTSVEEVVHPVGAYHLIKWWAELYDTAMDNNNYEGIGNVTHNLPEFNQIRHNHITYL